MQAMLTRRLLLPCASLRLFEWPVPLLSVLELVTLLH